MGRLRGTGAGLGPSPGPWAEPRVTEGLCPWSAGSGAEQGAEGMRLVAKGGERGRPQTVHGARAPADTRGARQCLGSSETGTRSVGNEHGELGILPGKAQNCKAGTWWEGRRDSAAQLPAGWEPCHGLLLAEGSPQSGRLRGRGTVPISRPRRATRSPAGLPRATRLAAHSLADGAAAVSALPNNDNKNHPTSEQTAHHPQYGRSTRAPKAAARRAASCTGLAL